jgi:hypothetical protein
MIGLTRSCVEAGSTENQSSEVERQKWKERIIQLESQLNEQRVKAEELTAKLGKSLPRTSAPPVVDLSDIREMLTTALSELRSAEIDKRQIQIKSENEQNLSILERRFNKQLNEARRKNELMIDNLKVNYENEINELKAQKAKMEDLIRGLEMECVKKQADIDRLLATIDNDQRTVKLANCTQKQTEMIVEFLRKNLSKSEVRDLENTLKQPTASATTGTAWYGPIGGH